MDSKKVLLLALVVLEWFSLPMQLLLHMQGSDVNALEAVMRYFGYFTILTNLLVCVYTTTQLLGRNNGWTNFFLRPSIQTAITMYIVVVGLIYNLILRSLWSSTGMQAVLHDLLHTISPILVLLYWWKFVDNRLVSYRNIPFWLIFPVAYTLITLVRGHFAHWYPYPFLEIDVIGVNRLIQNSALLLALFAIFGVALVWIGRRKPFSEGRR